MDSASYGILTGITAEELEAKRRQIEERNKALSEERNRKTCDLKHNENIRDRWDVIERVLKSFRSQ